MGARPSACTLGKAIFVPYAIPGERVPIEIVEERIAGGAGAWRC